MARPLVKATCAKAGRVSRFATIVVLVCSFAFRIAEAASSVPPNVVIILVDDMGWSDIGCYGGEIPTPHLDALASRGIRFTQCYNTGRCSPSRASLLTGQYPHQVGMGHLDGTIRPGHPGFQGRLANSCMTIAEVLQTAGYFTAMTGKWHLGQRNGSSPWERGFQRSLNLVAGGVHFYNQTLRKNADPHLYLDGEARRIDDPMFGTWYGADLWTEWGLKFVDDAIKERKPFFLYLAHCAPHFPLMAPQSAIAKHRGKYRSGWDQLRNERYRRQIELQLIDPKWRLSDREESSPAWNSLSPELQQRFDHMMAIYAAMIETMDESVGELVAGLKGRDVFDNTLVLFLSDNGGNAESGPMGRYEGEQPGGPASNVFLGQNWATLNNTPFRKWKRRVHEGGIATPLIAHWPEGIDAAASGTLIHQPAHVIDIMSTVVEVTRANYPTQYQGHTIEPMEGTSLAGTFAGGAVTRPIPLFFNHDDNRAVRDGAWKLVALQDMPWELYDMSADRTELHNLAEDRPDIVAKMSADYDKWSHRTRVVVEGELPTLPPEAP